LLLLLLLLLLYVTVCYERITAHQTCKTTRCARHHPYEGGTLGALSVHAHDHSISLDPSTTQQKISQFNPIMPFSLVEKPFDSTVRPCGR